MNGYFPKAAWLALLSSLSCSEYATEGVTIARRGDEYALRLGQKVPDMSEATAAGQFESRVLRKSAAFSRLIRCDDEDIVFKDEEGTGADRMMTSRLLVHLRRLSRSVRNTWPGVMVRVTEAWDDVGEHGAKSLHYEGRAADLTTSDLDSGKLGRLSRLAVDAGFDWVFYEDSSHVHVSVARDP